MQFPWPCAGPRNFLPTTHLADGILRSSSDEDESNYSSLYGSRGKEWLSSPTMAPRCHLIGRTPPSSSLSINFVLQLNFASFPRVLSRCVCQSLNVRANKDSLRTTDEQRKSSCNVILKQDFIVLRSINLRKTFKEIISDGVLSLDKVESGCSVVDEIETRL